MLVYFTTTHIYTSVNGTTWVSRTVPVGYTSPELTCFCDANTYTVFFSQEDSNNSYAYKTTDGITWTKSSSSTNSVKVHRCGCITGSDTVVFGYENSSAGMLFYTNNGTNFINFVGGAMYGYFPPTPLRQEHWYINSTTAFRSTDGVTFSDASRPIRTGTFTAGQSFVFGGVMISSADTSTPNASEFLNYAQSMMRFSDVMVSNGVYPSLSGVAMASTQGEFLSQNTSSTGWNPRPVGTWLEPGDHLAILVGGGGQNVSTTVGGCAGTMVRHRFTVTEKHRWIAYNIAGATAIVDVGGSDGLQADNFLAYASFSAYGSQPGPNQACFGDEVYYGMPALQAGGAACGPSGGYPAYRGLSSTALGCGTAATTTATTPNDWWDPEDWIGNASGKGYPGTAGSDTSQIGLLGAWANSGSGFGSFGSGGCNTSTAFGQRGGEPLIIIYAR
jgi:hypothetical protein